MKTDVAGVTTVMHARQAHQHCADSDNSATWPLHQHLQPQSQLRARGCAGFHSAGPCSCRSGPKESPLAHARRQRRRRQACHCCLRRAARACGSRPGGTASALVYCGLCSSLLQAQDLSRHGKCLKHSRCCDQAKPHQPRCKLHKNGMHCMHLCARHSADLGPIHLMRSLSAIWRSGVLLCREAASCMSGNCGKGGKAAGAGWSTSACCCATVCSQAVHAQARWRKQALPQPCRRTISGCECQPSGAYQPQAATPCRSPTVRPWGSAASQCR